MCKRFAVASMLMFTSLVAGAGIRLISQAPVRIIFQELGELKASVAGPTVATAAGLGAENGLNCRCRAARRGGLAPILTSLFTGEKGDDDDELVP